MIWHWDRNGYQIAWTAAGRWFLLLLCLLPSLAFAQNPPHWRYWQARNGLRESNSSSVFLDRSGEVLVNHGHVDEMSVLDGYTIRRLPSPGVGVPVIEGASGQLWSLNSQGFLTLALGSPKPSWTPLPVENFISPRRFCPVGRDRVLYLHSNRIQLFSVGGSPSDVLKDSTPLGEYIDVIVDADETVWMACEKGLIRTRLDPTGLFFTDWQEFPLPDSLALSQLDSLIRNDDGTLFATAFDSRTKHRVLVEFRDSAWNVLYRDAERDVLSGWRGEPDTMWVVLEPFSLLCIEKGRVTPVESSQVLSRVWRDVALDRNGAFWLSTSEGLARYAPAAWRTPPETASINQVVHAIRQDAAGRIWFASLRHLIRRERGRWTIIALPPGRQTTELAADSLCLLPDGRLLLKTNNDALAFDPSSERFEPFRHPQNHTLLVFSARTQGGFYAITQDDPYFRLEQFDGLSFTLLYSEDNPTRLNSNIRQIHEVSPGVFLLGGLDGLFLLQNGKLRQITEADGFTDTAAYCIHSLSPSQVWVGGREAVHAWDGQKWTRILSGQDGVRSITTGRDGSLWVASGAGLFRFTLDSWVANTFEDGLPDASVYEIFEDRDGGRWAGTTSGLSFHHPDADPDTPETYITNDRNSREIAPSGGQILYSGIDKWNYTLPARLLYSHRIDGTIWSPFTPETLLPISPDLPAGPHRLEVRCMDRNYNIDSTPASFEFTMLLPWYREPIVQVILFVGTVILIASLGLHLSHHRNLGQRVAQKTKDLREANRQLRKLASELSLVEERERRRMASDLHDSIGQTLALSMIKLDALQDSLPSPEPVREVETIKDLIDRTLQSSRELTFELCPPILYEIGFEAAVEQVVDQIRTQYGIPIETDIHLGSQPLSDEVRYFLFRASRELLMNVVKHAKATAVNLNAEVSNGMIEVRVEDNGVGFSADRAASSRHGFGLFSIRERLRQMGGEWLLDSRPGAGTRITMRVPASEEKF